MLRIKMLAAILSSIDESYYILISFILAWYLLKV